MDTTPEVTMDENIPLVSILMLTFNRAPYLKQAVESVLRQSYPHFELIIIDDGSTDGTSAVLNELTDSRIHVVRHTENKGLLLRRQESLILARGTYVAVLDSDDVWLPEKLERQVDYMNTNPTCVLVGTWITKIDENDKEHGEVRYATEDTSIRKSIFWRNQFAHSSVLMRKSTLNKTLGYRFPLDEDLDLFLQIGLHGTFGNIPEPLTQYRVHSNNKSANRRGMIENVLRILNTHRNNYPGYLPALVKYSIAYLLTSLSR